MNGTCTGEPGIGPDDETDQTNIWPKGYYESYKGLFLNKTDRKFDISNRFSNWKQTKLIIIKDMYIQFDQFL